MNLFFVMLLAGGTARSLLRVSAPERLIWRFDWTSDGRALAVAKERGDTGRKELWLVPVTEERPRKLDVDVDNWLLVDGFRLDRAGKQIAFVAAASRRRESWPGNPRVGELPSRADDGQAEREEIAVVTQS